MKPLLMSILLLCSAALIAQSVPHSIVPHKKGIAHTEQVDIAYETLGTQSAALPVIAVNGGPGLPHSYMGRNDRWERVAKHPLVGFYAPGGSWGGPRVWPRGRPTREAPDAAPCAGRPRLQA